MSRTIAEILAYNRRYAPELNPKIFSETNTMHPEVADKIESIVAKFLEFTQIEDLRILDIRVVGSNASFNYNEDSDLDVHIVVDLSEVSNPETIAQLYFGEVKHAFKETYDIKIKGIEVELYVEDVNASTMTNGIYSVSDDRWIKEPTPMEDPTDEEFARAEEIEEELIGEIEANKNDAKALEGIIDRIYMMRKDGLASEGETSPANLAFKSLRNKGILTRTKDIIKSAVSKELSLEGKEISESLEGYIKLDSVDKLLDYLNDPSKFPVNEKGLDVSIVTADGYDFYWWWGENSDYPQGYPICQIDLSAEKTLFHSEGVATNPKELLDRAIKKIRSYMITKKS